ncbi:MAG: enoyl-CoA hydratase/isomerase family protein [Hydrogenophaga sp.]|uniref:enoyl-CoA hydratase/isomerase family protein n=1 Tax=Hydrogenophaga sp. TaxID=1904254 RepID=UPI003D1353A4
MPIEGPAFDTIRLELQGALAWITLQRPEAMNSMSPQMLADLTAALDFVEARHEVRCLAIRGTGKAFCAGADLKAVKGFGDGEDEATAIRLFLARATALLRRIELLPMPVIAAVNGLALAGGLETVLVCDLVVAAEEAKFGDAHARYGLIPGWGGSARLPRKIGPNRAKWMMFSAEMVSAATMAEWGLVHQVVPGAELESTVQALAARMTDKSPLGLRRMKQLVDDGLEQPLEVALRNERVMVEAHNASHDRREGLEAFAQKRPPRFNGT